MNLAEFQIIEHTNALYRKITPVLLFTSLTICCLVVVTLWFHYHPVFIICWFLVAGSLQALRYFTKIEFCKVTLTQDNYRGWLNKLLLYSFLLGLSWGIVLLFSVSSQHLLELLILTTIYFALTSTSSSYMGVYFPAYLAFVLPQATLFIVKLIYIGESTYYIFAALVATYFLFITTLARNTHARENKVSELTFQNKELYDKVVAQKEVAENAVLAKNQFLAAASHDLRQPMHAQGLFITALEYSDLPDKAKPLANKIKRSSTALSSLLNGLLDISRLDYHSVEFEPKAVELDPILYQIHQQYFDSAADQETELELKISTSIYVDSDEQLLTRLIRNLVDNAVKFTQNGKITVCVTTQKKHAIISISDTGKGIPEHEQQNIFSEFTQLNNPERDRQKGLGLGLAIVKRLTALMKMPIKMHSIEGKGTTFSLTLPLTESTQLDSTPTVEPQLNSNDSLADQVIVVIDDNKTILDAMRLIIEQWQAKIVTAETPESAISTLDHFGLQPTLIISDLRLRKNKTGIDAIHLLRKEFNNPISAILITGDTATKQTELAKDSELPLLYKPIDAEQLRAKINELLDV